MGNFMQHSNLSLLNDNITEVIMSIKHSLQHEAPCIFNCVLYNK